MPFASKNDPSQVYLSPQRVGISGFHGTGVDRVLAKLPRESARPASRNDPYPCDRHACLVRVADSPGHAHPHPQAYVAGFIVANILFILLFSIDLRAKKRQYAFGITFLIIFAYHISVMAAFI